MQLGIVGRSGQHLPHLASQMTGNTLVIKKNSPGVCRALVGKMRKAILIADNFYQHCSIEIPTVILAPCSHLPAQVDEFGGSCLVSAIPLLQQLPPVLEQLLSHVINIPPARHDQVIVICKVKRYLLPSTGYILLQHHQK